MSARFIGRRLSRDLKKDILKKYLLVSIISSMTCVSFAQGLPGNLPPIPGNIPSNPNLPIDPSTLVEQTENNGTKSTTIKVPIKNDQGDYEVVDVVITDDGTTQSVNIPGHGDIAVVTDENGDHNLEITPENIKGSDNISCKYTPTSSNKTTCTATPLLIVKGNTVYSADQATFEYQEGQNVAKVDIASDNLLITNQYDQTEITKDKTNLGTASISIVAFGEDVGGGSGGIPGVTNPGPDVKQADALSIVATTSTLKHTVTNPNNPSDQRVKLEVPAGVQATLYATQSDSGDLTVNSSGTLNGPFKYDSDPFSDNKVVAESTSGAGYSVSYAESGDKSYGTFVVGTAPTTPDGKVSELVVTDTSKSGQQNTVTSQGATSLIINQEVDSSSGKDVPGQTNFFLGSENLTAVTSQDGKEDTTLTLTGATVVGEGNQQTKEGNVAAQADSITFNDPNNGKDGLHAGLIGNVNASVIADGKGKIATASSDQAFFSNKGLEIRADGNINVMTVEETNPSKSIDGQAVTRESFASGNTISISDGDKTTRFTGGVGYYQADLADGSTVQQVGGEQGTLSSGDMAIQIKDGASVTNKLDKDGKVQSSTVQATDLTGTNQDLKFNTQQSYTSMAVTGKTADGVDIRSYLHSSSSISAATDSESASFRGVNGSLVDEDKIRYGNISFDEGEIKHGIQGDGTFDGKVTLNNGSMFFYSDETDPNKPFTQGSFSGEAMNYNSSDYNINITAIGKDGKPGNFTIFFLENGPEKIIEVYGEDGKRVRIDGEDADGNFGEILAQTARYYENDQFKTFLATEVSGTARPVKDGDKDTIAFFNAARFEGYETTDGKTKIYNFENGSITASSQSENASGNVSAETGSYSQVTVGDTTTTQSSFTNGRLSGSQFSQTDDGTTQLDTSGVIDFTNFNSFQTDGPNGQTSYFDIGGASIFGTAPQDGVSLSGDVDQATFYSDDTTTIGQISGGNNLQIRTDGKDPGTTDQATFMGLDAYGVKTDTMKFGTMTFDSGTVDLGKSLDGTVDGRVTLLDGSMMFYENTEDPDHVIRQGTYTGGNVYGNNQDYNITITAIGDDGTPGKFTLYFLEDGPEKVVQIFGEDGKKVSFAGADKDGNWGNILARTVQTYENDKFKQFMVTELEGSSTTFTPGEDGDNIARGFNIARMSGYEEKDGSFKGYTAQDVSLFQTDYNAGTDVRLNTENASFTQTNYLGTIASNMTAYQSTINFTEYKDGNVNGQKKTEAEIQIGSMISSQIESPDGKKISMLRVQDIDLMAIDYDEMIKATGHIGGVSSFNSDQMSVVDITDIENLRVESLEQDMNALFNGKQFLKVDQKDANGNVTNSYLLVRDASAKVRFQEDNLTGKVDLNARVFEYVKDNVTGQTTILRADADFKAKATYDTGIGSVSARVHGAIKGENISTSSTSFESEDGKRSGGTFTIHADKLQKLEFGAKVGFIDLIEFKASGENGKSIHYSYEIDEGQGVLKLRGVYKDGDKLETKFLFFKLKSHKEGNDAVQALTMRLKGQSFADHQAIISETASIREVTDFIGVSDGGAIRLTTGAADKGFSMDLIVHNEKFAFNHSDSIRVENRPSNSYIVGLNYTTEDNTKWGIQTGLTSDSRIEVDGDLYAFGQKVDDIPMTANFNVTYENSDRDLSVLAGINAPLTTYMVDTDKLDDDAQFYDGGKRKAAGPGAHVAVTKKYDNSELRMTAGMYDNFKDPAVMVSYQGSPQVLANLGRGIINIAQGEPFDKGFKSTSGSKKSRYQRQKERQERIRDQQIQETEAKRMVILEKEIDKLIAYYDQFEGYSKVKGVLQTAKKYLNSPIDHYDYRKNIFDFSIEDRAEFAFFEPDSMKVEAIDTIIMGIIENKIMVQLPLDFEAREDMLDIYRQRRYYDNLKSVDLLAEINKTDLTPCEYFRQQHVDKTH